MANLLAVGGARTGPIARFSLRPGW